ncbi:MAG: hypothetical protein Q4A37_02810 [Candidatus Saccharibacteria bacterium]|nr:hypothetical protein [Candidatus Saccharibacteria bacterium]
MSKEQLQHSTGEVINTKEAERTQHEAHDRIGKQLEREANRAETNAERQKNIHEAMEVARNTAESATETARTKEAKRKPASRERRILTKADRKQAFDKTMQTVQSQLSAPSRTFSKFIHNPIVEKVSDVAGNTIARPNAILSGSLAALILTLAIYFIARRNGYPLSGTEMLAAFFVGWVIGNIIDYARIALGRRK